MLKYFVFVFLSAWHTVMYELYYKNEKQQKLKLFLFNLKGYKILYMKSGKMLILSEF